jgi:redox-sensitive bicupin YhaK (pirin superfamily)
MPAANVDDIDGLPTIEMAADEGRTRPVRSVTNAPSGLEGNGFPVKRAFAGVDLADLDPFVHLDEMGEVDYSPGEAKGTPWHPHRGFETVTYMIDGVMQHEDSNGGGGRITDGDTQWMTAGSGILHIEEPPEALVRSGGLFHGLQLWVNLPRAKKWASPNYQRIEGRAVTLLRSADSGALVRLIAGTIGDHIGPGSTHTPINVAHASLEPGAKLVLPWPRQYSALVYVLAGDATVGPERRLVHAGHLAVFGGGAGLSVASTGRSADGPLEVLLLGGLPIREPVAWQGPFVMNTRREVNQAFEDFRAGRLGTIPAGQTRA